MQNLLSNLLITIIASAVVSILTWLLLNLLNRVFIPWYSSVIYKGVKIDGKWITTVPFKKGTNHKEVIFHETFDIKQKGNDISGTCSIKNQFEIDSSISTYDIKGTLINGYVTLTCIINSQSETGMMNLLLKICEGGTALTGSVIWIDRNGEDILTFTEYRLVRTLS